MKDNFILSKNQISKTRPNEYYEFYGRLTWIKIFKKLHEIIQHHPFDINEIIVLK